MSEFKLLEIARLRAELADAKSACEALEAERERLRAQCDAILLQARCWAGEAKAQQSITREVGAALGGIPTWGPIAAGVEAMRAERDALAAELEGANARILLDAKNHWAERARKAEAELAAIKGKEPVGVVHLRKGGGISMLQVELNTPLHHGTKLYTLPAAPEGGEV